MISIVGARNKELVILENEMREVSDALMSPPTTARYADKGFVTDKLEAADRERHAHRPRARHRADADDAGGRRDDAQGKDPHHRQPELDHDGRHGHVRRLPRYDRRQERIRMRGRPRVRRAPAWISTSWCSAIDVPRTEQIASTNGSSNSKQASRSSKKSAQLRGTA